MLNHKVWKNPLYLSNWNIFLFVDLKWSLREEKKCFFLLLPSPLLRTPNTHNIVLIRPYTSASSTCLVVMHPVQHDLRSPVPPSGYIACHFIICMSSQSKIQDLRERREIRHWNKLLRLVKQEGKNSSAL